MFTREEIEEMARTSAESHESLLNRLKSKDSVKQMLRGEPITAAEADGYQYRKDRIGKNGKKST